MRGRRRLRRGGQRDYFADNCYSSATRWPVLLVWRLLVLAPAGVGAGRRQHGAVAAQLRRRAAITDMGVPKTLLRILNGTLIGRSNFKSQGHQVLV